MSQRGSFLTGSQLSPIGTITGNTGGPVGPDGTGNINVVGTGNITVSGNAGTNTETITFTGVLPIANGGTNTSSFFPNNGTVYFDGTSLTNTLPGNAGEVLTSNGGGLAPTYQATAASSISITGDTGGALIGNAFTFTGGTTGLSFGGSGSTETLSGTLAIANGGTNATSFTQSNGIVTYNGTSLVNYAGPQINSSGQATNTTQPAFSAYLASVVNNVTGDGTNYTLGTTNLTKLFDNDNNFNVNGTFTAPVTGKYQLNVMVLLVQLITAMQPSVEIVTTTRTYIFGNFGTSPTGNIPMSFTILTDMSATDTAVVKIVVNGGTKIVDVYGAPGDYRTVFSGNLVC